MPLPTDIAPSAAGKLTKTPFPHLLVYLFDRQLDGSIFFTAGDGTEHIVCFTRGAPSKVMLTYETTHLGRVLLELGLLKQEVLDRSLERFAEHGGLHGQLLISMGAIDRAKLIAGLREQVMRRMVTLFEKLDAETSYAFYGGINLIDSYGGPELTPVDPLRVLCRGVRACPDHPHVDPTLARLGSAPLVFHPAASDLGRFGFSKEELSVIDLMRARPSSLPDIIATGMLPERALKVLVYVLLITRNIDLGKRELLPVGVGQSVPGPPPTPVASDDVPSSRRPAQQLARVKLKSISYAQGPIQEILSDTLKQPGSGPIDPRASSPPSAPISSPVPTPPRVAPPVQSPSPPVAASSAPRPAPAPPTAQPFSAPPASRPSPIPSVAPTSSRPAIPTAAPTASRPAIPSVAPAASRTAIPSVAPTASRTAVPSAAPLASRPSAVPSAAPTASRPAVPSVAPMASRPSAVPSVPPMASRPSAVPSQAPTSVRGAATPAATNFDPNTASQREMIKNRAETIDRENLFVVLGVKPEASLDELQAAYFALAKQWHPDRLPAEVGDLKELAAKCFARMSEAFQTLTDPVRKAEYVELLKSNPISADEQAQVQAVLEAAMDFQKAEVFLRKREIEQAEAHAKRAFQNDPEQPEYAALWAWTTVLLREKAGNKDYVDPLRVLTTAIDREPECEKAYFYRALILQRQNKQDQAIRDFRKVFEINPRNIEAAREVRVHEMRGGSSSSSPPARGKGKGRQSDSKSTGGLLGKLFKR